MRYDSRKAPVESVVGLLGLGAGEGATIKLVGIGAQTQQAVEAVAAELLRAAHGEIEESPARAKSPTPVVAARASGEPLPPNTLAGVSASPGIAVGKLVCWDDQDIVPPEQASDPSAAESRALDKAIAQVDGELDETVRTASQLDAVGEAGIFVVHRVLLEDPTLVDAARDLISFGKSAGFAWREAIRAQIALLNNVDDELLAERTADLHDIEKRVLGLTNTAARDLPAEAVLAAVEFTPSDLSSLDRQRVMAPRDVARRRDLARGDHRTADRHSGARRHRRCAARDSRRHAGRRERIGGASRACADRSRRRTRTPNASGSQVCARRIARCRSRRHRRRTAIISKWPRISPRSTMPKPPSKTARTRWACCASNSCSSTVSRRRRWRSPRRAIRASSTPPYRAAPRSSALDVGADKEVDYLTLPPEENPALGLRGIRLVQVRPDLLDDQLRCLLAVKPAGAVRILLPMVTDSGELQRLRVRIDELAREMGGTEPIEVGVMIEVPSAALLADQLAKHADFLSIGTNDLTKYTLVMDRCQPDLAAQSDGLHPAMLRLIKAAVQGAEKHGKWVGVCGALGGDPVAAPLLVGLGRDRAVGRSGVGARHQGACAQSRLPTVPSARRGLPRARIGAGSKRERQATKSGRRTNRPFCGSFRGAISKQASPLKR